MSFKILVMPQVELEALIFSLETELKAQKVAQRWIAGDLQRAKRVLAVRFGGSNSVAT